MLAAATTRTRGSRAPQGRASVASRCAGEAAGSSRLALGASRSRRQRWATKGGKRRPTRTTTTRTTTTTADDEKPTEARRPTQKKARRRRRRRARSPTTKKPTRSEPDDEGDDDDDATTSDGFKDRTKNVTKTPTRRRWSSRTSTVTTSARARRTTAFEKDRFFVDKSDTDKTEKGTLVQGSLTSTSFGYTTRAAARSRCRWALADDRPATLQPAVHRSAAADRLPSPRRRPVGRAD